MSISFERQGNDLILIYSPEVISIDDLLRGIEDKGQWQICQCFSVEKKHLKSTNSVENSLYFRLGTIQDGYYSLDRDIMGTDNRFFISVDVKLSRRHFIAYRNISILRKINELVKHDVYIGGTADGCIPVDVYESLIKAFPKTAELNRYAHSRISTILKEYLPSLEKYEKDYLKYISNHGKVSSLSPVARPSFHEKNSVIELKQFQDAKKEFEDLLDRSDCIREDVWQNEVNSLIRFLYPKYIAGVREINIKGVDKHDKRPDFILVDANGCIDILEIKRPSARILTKQSTYRNNYVPVRELAGAIQQIEKYIHCINSNGRDGVHSLHEQISSHIPTGMTVNVVNPTGILLIGRSNDFNSQQKIDFELIKRQYKNIADIMTYDDVLQRINNIIMALTLETGL